MRAAMPAFFGMEARPGRRTPYVPPPEEMRLHLTGATLGAEPRKGERVVLKVRVSESGGEGGREIFVCSFRGGGQEHCPLDLVLDEYAEFSIEGACSVHLVGYYMPEFGPEDMGDSSEEEDDQEWMEGDSESDYSSSGEGEDSDLEDEEREHLRRALMEGGAVFVDSDDSEGYDDYSEEDNSDEEAPELVPMEDRPTIEEVFGEEGEADEAEAKVKGKRTRAEKKDEAAKAGKGAVEDADGNLRLPQKRGAGEVGVREVRAAKRLEGEGISNKKEQPQKEKARGEGASSKEKGSKGAAEEPKKGGKVAAEGSKKGGKGGKGTEEGPNKGENGGKGKEKAQQEDIRRYPNGFEVIVLTRGAPDAKVAKPGKRVQVRYTGRLQTNGKVFDKTKGSATFSFRLGVGEVIQGWDVGVRGMRVGDKRRLTVPPEMGYGNQTQGPIPANSTLVFDVELVGVK